VTSLPPLPPRPVESPHNSPAAEVVAALAVDVAVGLTEADALRRLERIGENRLEEEAARSVWSRMADQVRSPLVLLLLVAIPVSLLAWALEDADGLPFDAIVIAVIVAANAAIGVVQEVRADQAVAALQRLTDVSVTVRRDGTERRVPARVLVPGDVVVLAEGDAVSADARLVEAAGLRVAEASLTGESEPVDKRIQPVEAAAPLGDRTCMVFSGTSVVGGRGTAVVTATGMASQIGIIAGLLERTEEQPTPLQREIEVVGGVLARVVVVAAVVVIAALLLFAETDGAAGVVDALLIGVSLAVAAVPEGLPAILSVVLALGVQRMGHRNALVKRLASVETLGSATVICTDKTGTLTRGEMTAVTVVTASGDSAVSGVGYGSEGSVTTVARGGADAAAAAELASTVRLGVAASDARLRGGGGLGGGELGGGGGDGDGGDGPIGDPTELALVALAVKTGLDVARWREAHPRLGALPFDADRKRMTVVDRCADDAGVSVASKGAPDVLLARCVAERVGDRDLPLTDERRRWWLAQVDAMANRALRTMAVAAKRAPRDVLGIDEDGTPVLHPSVEDGLAIVGVVGIIDPPRDEVRRAIEEARAAGIRTVMITGDHPATARRIADDVGLRPASVGEVTGVRVLAGHELDGLDDAALDAVVPEIDVYARVAPNHKLRIVEALQRRREVVAMTGDGVNDAPALKAADIGVAMGISGTDVSKQAARMILTDDNYATIVAAVREGRAIFHNIRGFLRYLLSSNAGEVLTMFLGIVLAAVIGLRDPSGAVVAPLLATQILWINLLTDTAPALALGVDPPGPTLMRRPPAVPGSHVIDGPMRLGIALVGLTMAGITIATLDLELPGGLVDGDSGVGTARTAAFTTLVLAQLFNCFSARSDTDSALVGAFRNRLLLLAVALAATLQVAVVHLPFLNEAFGTEPLSVGQWARSTALASLVLWVSEARKVVVRRGGAAQDSR
jgi:magnesium-transporting ATPase (P-type)